MTPLNVLSKITLFVSLFSFSLSSMASQISSGIDEQLSRDSAQNRRPSIYQKQVNLLPLEKTQSQTFSYMSSLGHLTSSVLDSMTKAVMKGYGVYTVVALPIITALETNLRVNAPSTALMPMSEIEHLTRENCLTRVYDPQLCDPIFRNTVTQSSSISSRYAFLPQLSYIEMEVTAIDRLKAERRNKSKVKKGRNFKSCAKEKEREDFEKVLKALCSEGSEISNLFEPAEIGVYLKFHKIFPEFHDFGKSISSTGLNVDSFVEALKHEKISETHVGLINFILRHKCIFNLSNSFDTIENTNTILDLNILDIKNLILNSFTTKIEDIGFSIKEQFLVNPRLSLWLKGKNIITCIDLGLFKDSVIGRDNNKPAKKDSKLIFSTQGAEIKGINFPESFRKIKVNLSNHNILFLGIEIMYTKINDSYQKIKTNVLSEPIKFISGEFDKDKAKGTFDRTEANDIEHIKIKKDFIDKRYGMWEEYTNSQQKEIFSSCINTENYAKNYVNDYVGTLLSSPGQAFYHTEQGVLNFLASDSQKCEEEKRCFVSEHFNSCERPDFLILHMKSYKSICDKCAQTLYHESEGGHLFLNKYNKHIYSIHQKNNCPMESYQPLKLFINYQYKTLSGTSKEALGSGRSQYQPYEITDIFPSIAQKQIIEEDTADKKTNREDHSPLPKDEDINAQGYGKNSKQKVDNK